MTDDQQHDTLGATLRRLGMGPAIVWLALLILLAATCWSAFVPLGSYPTMIHLTLAAIMLFLLATFLMNLGKANALLRLVAAAGLFWVIFLFALTFADYLSRRAS